MILYVQRSAAEAEDMTDATTSKERETFMIREGRKKVREKVGNEKEEGRPVIYTVCCISLGSRMMREIRDPLFGVTKYVTIRSLSFRCTSPEGIKRLCCNDFGLRFSPASPLYTTRSGQPNYFIEIRDKQ